MSTGRYRRAWYLGWPLALLCVLSASRWLFEGAVPATASSSFSEGLGCLFAGLSLGLLGFSRFAHIGKRPAAVLWTGVTGTALVVAGMPLARTLAGTSLGANNVTLAEALCPVVIAVCLSLSARESDGNLTARMWPGLAGIAGLLLLLPEPQYSSWRTWVGLVGLPLLVGVGATLVARTLQPGMGLDPAAAGVGLILAGAVYLCLWYSRRVGTEVPVPMSLQAAGLDGVTALLTLLALSRLGAVRWSAQFLVIPLVGLVEGILFLRPILDGKAVLGLVIIAFSAGYQVLMSSAERSSVLLLGLHEESGIKGDGA